MDLQHSTPPNIFDGSFILANGSRRGLNSISSSGQTIEQRRGSITPTTPSRPFLNGTIAEAIGSPAHRFKTTFFMHIIFFLLFELILSQTFGFHLNLWLV